MVLITTLVTPPMLRASFSHELKIRPAAEKPSIKTETELGSE
jgi:hypothetical protein